MMDDRKIINQVSDSCEFPCRASLHLPKEVMEYHTDTKPTIIGSNLNTDIMKESGQKNPGHLRKPHFHDYHHSNKKPNHT